MLLAIDVGNTQTVIGLYDGQTLVRMWRIATSHTQTSDELRVCLQGLLDMEGISAEKVTGAVLATVVPKFKRLWLKVAALMFGVEALSIDAQVAKDLVDTSVYRSTIGADRVADAVAARFTYGAPVIVLDFGTATNIEVIDADGNFAGGIIAPGVETSMKALFSNAALLPEVELVDPGTALGLDTAEVMQVGIVYGEADRVDGLVRRVWRQLGYETPVVATGGLSAVMGDLCQTVTHVDAELTLHGLRLIHEHVVGPLD